MRLSGKDGHELNNPEDDSGLISNDGCGWIDELRKLYLQDHKLQADRQAQTGPGMHD